MAIYVLHLVKLLIRNLINTEILEKKNHGMLKDT